MAAPKAATIRLVPVPGLNFEPVDATPEEAAELLASGSFRKEQDPADAAADDDKEARP